MNIINKNQDIINNLFSNTTDIFLKAMNCGFPEINSNDINLNNKLLEEYLEIGCEYIKKGLDPNAIQLLMESLLYNIVKTKDVVEVDIFQLVLLKKIIRLLQEKDVNLYLEYQEQFVSYPDRAYNESKLLSII